MICSPPEPAEWRRTVHYRFPSSRLTVGAISGVEGAHRPDGDQVVGRDDRGGQRAERRDLVAGPLTADVRERGRDLSWLEPELDHHLAVGLARSCAALLLPPVMCTMSRWPSAVRCSRTLRAAYRSSVVTTSTPGDGGVPADQHRGPGAGELAQLGGGHQRAEQREPGDAVLEQGPDQRGLLGGRAGARCHEEIEAGVLGRGGERGVDPAEVGVGHVVDEDADRVQPLAGQGPRHTRWAGSRAPRPRAAPGAGVRSETLGAPRITSETRARDTRAFLATSSCVGPTAHPSPLKCQDFV